MKEHTSNQGTEKFCIQDIQTSNDINFQLFDP